MAQYQIQVSDEAEQDLEYFKASDRRTILEHIILHLSYEPLTETKKKKKLRDNDIAPWELKYGQFRIFYSVEEEVVTTRLSA
jgi:mRNA-degrading endonuclease RelE of RelBE toxin-antitoxin system